MIKQNKKSLVFIFIYIIVFFLGTTIVEGSEYHIGTYNILVANKKTSWDKRKENLCNFILFNDYDIFGTQEVSPDQLVFFNNNLKSIYSNFDVGQNVKNNDEHCTIFYKTKKFELLDGNTFWLSETPDKISKGWDASINRICTWVRLKDKNNNNEIWFFNTHLDNKGAKSREESCKLILKKIKELCPKDANIVLVGDFNVYYNNPVLKPITESQILKDTYTAANYKWTPTGTFNANSFDKINIACIDQVFVSKTSNVLRYGILNNNSFVIDDKPVTDIRKITANDYKNKTINTLPLSDHYPVSVFVDFKDSSNSNNSNASQNESIEKQLLKKLFKKKK